MNRSFLANCPSQRAYSPSLTSQAPSSPCPSTEKRTLRFNLVFCVSVGLALPFLCSRDYYLCFILRMTVEVLVPTLKFYILEDTS